MALFKTIPSSIPTVATTTQASAQTTNAGAGSAYQSIAEAKTQTQVNTKSQGFRRAVASATAPRIGLNTATIRLEAVIAYPQSSVPRTGSATIAWAK